MSDNKKPANLDLSALLEADRPTITMPDGKVYEFAVEGDFGALEYARYKRCLKVINSELAGLVDIDNDDEEQAAKMDAAIDGVLALILPDLPPEELAKLTLGAKSKVFEFWYKEAGIGRVAEPSGKALAAEATARIDELDLDEDQKALLKEKVAEIGGVLDGFAEATEPQGE
jgi:hypothetical protein